MRNTLFSSWPKELLHHCSSQHNRNVLNEEEMIQNRKRRIDFEIELDRYILKEKEHVVEPVVEPVQVEEVPVAILEHEIASGPLDNETTISHQEDSTIPESQPIQGAEAVEIPKNEKSEDGADEKPKSLTFYIMNGKSFFPVTPTGEPAPPTLQNPKKCVGEPTTSSEPKVEFNRKLSQRLLIKKAKEISEEEQKVKGQAQDSGDSEDEQEVVPDVISLIPIGDTPKTRRQCAPTVPPSGRDKLECPFCKMICMRRGIVQHVNHSHPGIPSLIVYIFVYIKRPTAFGSRISTWLYILN